MSSSPRPSLQIVGKVSGRRPHPHLIWLGLLAIVTLAATVGAGGYIAYWQGKALPGTTVGALKVEGMNRGQLAEKLVKQSRSLTVEVKGAATSKVSLSQAGIEPQIAATVEKVFEPNRTWTQVLRSLFTTRQVVPAARIDHAMGVHAARQLATAPQNPVQDPAVAPTEDGQFVIQPGHAGQGVDPKKLQQAALEVWQKQNPQTLKMSFENTPPLAPDPYLEQWRTQAAALISPAVTLRTPKGRVFHISNEQKTAWVSFPPVFLPPNQLAHEQPKLDKTLIHNWLGQFTAENVDYQPPKGKRRLTKDGKLLQVVSAAYSGVRATNLDEMSDQIFTALNAKEPVTAKFTTEITEGDWEDISTNETLPVVYKARPGEKWISVDVKNNIVSAYVGDQIVWGPKAVVTGSLPAPTVVGTFKVYLKYSSQKMKGDGWDGPYESWAPWVMYFHRDYALHGAPWRSQMVYHPYGGSHGCVNLTVADAKWLYDWAPYGTVVVTHH